MAYAAEAEAVRGEELLAAVRVADMPHMGRRDRGREIRRLVDLAAGRSGLESAAARQARWDRAWRALRGLPGVSGPAADSRPSDPRMARILRPGERVVLPEEG